MRVGRHDMTTLLDLPAELLLNIITFLSKEEVKSARLICRHVEQISFDHFAHIFFRKRGFMITNGSLATLKDIAHDKGISKHVQHVWFNPDCFTFVTNPAAFMMSTGEIEAVEDFERFNAFEKYKSEHWVLLHTVRLVAVLTDVFSHLPNLKTVGMRRGDDHNAHGWQHIQAEVGLDPRTLGPDYKRFATVLSDSTYLFIAMIKALSASHSRVRRFYTDAIQIDYVVRDTGPTYAEYQAALRSVNYIELNATGLAGDAEGPHQEGSETCGQNLQTILRSLPELFEIGLTIFKDTKQRHMIPPVPHQYSSWATTYPFMAFRNISTNVELQHLRRVKLEKICTTAAALCSFFKPAKACLMSLKLRHIRLLSDGDIEEEDRSWQPFFAFLCEECPSTEYLLLHALYCNDISVRFQESVPAESTLRQGIPVVGNTGTFVDYNTINIELVGHESIQHRLATLVDDHWYGRKLFTFAMDESVWFTDTSDEDW